MKLFRARDQRLQTTSTSSVSNGHYIPRLGVSNQTRDVTFSISGRVNTLAVLPAFGVILFSAAKHHDLTKQQVQRNAIGVARAIVAEQERFFETAHQLLLMISRVPQVRDKNSCGKFLLSLLEPLYADLGIRDAKANFVCSALPAGNALVRFKGLHHKRVVETHALSIGQVRKDARTGHTLMDLGFPVLESPGVLRGVVVVALNLS